MELLKYIEENGIIDLTYVQEQIKMKKRDEILKRHQYSIWFNEKENVWYSYLPDESKANNRRKIKRKNKNDLEKMICDYYQSSPDNHAEKEKPKESLSVENLFYEFMKHKTNEVNSGTVKRMMADWNRFYKPDEEFIAIPVKNLTKINIDDFFNSVLVLVSKKFALLKKPVNPSRFRTHPAVPELSALCIILAVFLTRINRKRFCNSSTFQVQ